MRIHKLTIGNIVQTISEPKTLDNYINAIFTWQSHVGCRKKVLDITESCANLHVESGSYACCDSIKNKTPLHQIHNLLRKNTSHLLS